MHEVHSSLCCKIPAKRFSWWLRHSEYEGSSIVGLQLCTEHPNYSLRELARREESWHGLGLDSMALGFIEHGTNSSLTLYQMCAMFRVALSETSSHLYEATSNSRFTHPHYAHKPPPTSFARSCPRYVCDDTFSLWDRLQLLVVVLHTPIFFLCCLFCQHTIACMFRLAYTST